MPINRDELRSSLQKSLPVTKEGVLNGTFSPSHRVAIGKVYRLVSEYAEDFSRLLNEFGIPEDSQAINKISTAYENIEALSQRQRSLKFANDSIQMKHLPYWNSEAMIKATELLEPSTHEAVPAIWLTEQNARKVMAMDLLLCQIELRDALISALPCIIYPDFFAELQSFANHGKGDAASLLRRVREIVDNAVFIHPDVQDAIVSLTDDSSLEYQQFAVGVFLENVGVLKKSEDNS